jgi:hypothetical protein
VTHPLLAPDGFSANQLRRLIENVVWLLHISVYDGVLNSVEGGARSVFPSTLLRYGSSRGQVLEFI